MKAIYIYTLSIFFLSYSLTAQTTDSLRLMNDLKELSSDKYEGRKPGTYGGRLAQFYLVNRFKEIGLSAYKDDYRQGLVVLSEKIDKDKPDSIENYRKIRGVNIIGFIPGKKKEAIVISAHYDHLGIIANQIYNGADDNASGTCAMLAIAEYFIKHPPQHTLIFVAFDAEEIFMRGSLAFISSPPVLLENIILNVNMDLIGTSKDKLLYAGGTRYSPAFKPILNSLRKKTKNVNLIFGYDIPKSKDDRTFRSDHGVFHLAGISYLYFGVPEHENYHKPSDDYENISHRFYYHATNFILKSIVAIDQDVPIEMITKKRLYH